MSMFRTNEMYKHSYLRLCFDNRSLHLNISWVVTCKLLSKKEIVREQQMMIHQWKFMAMGKSLKHIH